MLDEVLDEIAKLIGGPLGKRRTCELLLLLRGLLPCEPEFAFEMPDATLSGNVSVACS